MSGVDDLEGDINDFLKKKCGDFYYVCYSTASSTKENPKFRLVFPLTSDIPKSNIKHFWFAINKELGEVGDIQTKDLSRMYYIPGKYKKAHNFIFTNKGNYIEPEKLMEKHPYVEKTSNTFFDKLPKTMQDAMMEHMKSKLTNTQVTWT